MRMLLVGLLCLNAVEAIGEELRVLSRLEFRGEINSPANISGIAVFGDGEFLAIGADEGSMIQILRRVDSGAYQLHHIEGIAAVGD